MCVFVSLSVYLSASVFVFVLVSCLDFGPGLHWLVLSLGLAYSLVLTLGLAWIGLSWLWAWLGLACLDFAWLLLPAWF